MPIQRNGHLLLPAALLLALGRTPLASSATWAHIQPSINQHLQILSTAQLPSHSNPNLQRCMSPKRRTRRLVSQSFCATESLQTSRARAQFPSEGHVKEHQSALQRAAPRTPDRTAPEHSPRTSGGAGGLRHPPTEEASAKKTAGDTRVGDAVNGALPVPRSPAASPSSRPLPSHAPRLALLLPAASPGPQPSRAAGWRPWSRGTGRRCRGTVRSLHAPPGPGRGCGDPRRGGRGCRFGRVAVLLSKGSAG